MECHPVNQSNCSIRNNILHPFPEAHAAGKACAHLRYPQRFNMHTVVHTSTLRFGGASLNQHRGMELLCTPKAPRQHAAIWLWRIASFDGRLA